VADRTRALRGKTSELEQEVFMLKEKLRVEEEALRNKREVMEINTRNLRDEFQIREASIREELLQDKLVLERENLALLEQIRFLQDEVQMRS